MSYEVKTMKEALFGNPYVGRGIVAATACSSNRAKKSPSIPMTRAR